MTAMAGRLTRLHQRLRDRGLRGTLTKLFADHVFRSSESVILEIDLRAGRFGHAADLPAGVSIIMARTPGDLPALGAWLAPRAPAFRTMLAAGKVGIFAVQNGQAIGCAWCALSDHHERDAREFYRVMPGEAYTYCWLVDPAWRRSNVALPLCRFTFNRLRAMDVRRAFCVIDRVNRASYRIQSHFGGRETGVRVRHYHLFRQRWTRMSRYDGVLGLAST